MKRSFMNPLESAVEALREYYGPPAKLPTSDPFELILYENVAYLATPQQRREAFEMLKKGPTTDPSKILKTKPERLERITRGILRNTFATKLHECAKLVVTKFEGDLNRAISGSLESAKRALRTFPSIGEPGAEKILLFAGKQALLAPDSNILRALARIGFIEEDTSYTRMYAAGREVSKQLPQTIPAMQEAHLLLQLHGQTLCKRAEPLCLECPLAGTCGYTKQFAAK